MIRLVEGVGAMEVLLDAFFNALLSKRLNFDRQLSREQFVSQNKR